MHIAANLSKWLVQTFCYLFMIQAQIQKFVSLQGYIMTFFVPLQGITTIIPSHKSSLQPTSNPNTPPLSLILFIFVSKYTTSHEKNHLYHFLHVPLLMWAVQHRTGKRLKTSGRKPTASNCEQRHSSSRICRATTHWKAP